MSSRNRPPPQERKASRTLEDLILSGRNAEALAEAKRLRAEREARQACTLALPFNQSSQSKYGTQAYGLPDADWQVPHGYRLMSRYSESHTLRHNNDCGLG